MPRRSKQLDAFYHIFSRAEAENLTERLNRVGFQRNLANGLVLTNVCEEIVVEMRKKTLDARWTALHVKTFVVNNVQLYKKLCDYVINTVGVKYNLEQNRIRVAVEYWHFVDKETDEQVLFHQFGFPSFQTWSIIMKHHRPGQVLYEEAGSSPRTPIVVKEELFDPECPDMWDVQFPRTGDKNHPIPDKKLFKLMP